MPPSSAHAEILELLRREYGLDGERGGMSRTLGRFLHRRLRELELDEPAYLRRLREHDGERNLLLHSVTVGHSWFYRDPGQLDELRQLLRSRVDRGTQHIWIAGCATGEEAWTIALIATELGCDFRITASDVDSVSLGRAREGIYGRWTLRELPEALRSQYLESAGPDSWRIVDSLRQHVEFAEHNLCSPPLRSRSAGWDLITCRNVLIYFERDRATSTVNGLRASLNPDGRLFLGVGDLLFQLDEIDGQARSSGSRATATLAVVSGLRPQLPTRTSAKTSTKPPPSMAAGMEAPPPGRPPAALEPAPPPPAVALSPTQELLQRAGEAVESGQTAVAKPMLEGMLAGDPTIAEALLWLGVIHHIEGAPQAASEALRRARCMDPALWPATLFAALNAERLGRMPTAARCWSDLARALADPSELPGASEPLHRALPRWRAEAMELLRQRSMK